MRKVHPSVRRNMYYAHPNVSHMHVEKIESNSEFPLSWLDSIYDVTSRVKHNYSSWRRSTISCGMHVLENRMDCQFVPENKLKEIEDKKHC